MSPEAWERAKVLEEAAKLVEAWRPRKPGDGPLLLMDIRTQIAKAIRDLA